MSDFRRHLEEPLCDSGFAAEWDAQTVEREVMKSIVEVRLAENMTQQELAYRRRCAA